MSNTKEGDDEEKKGVEEKRDRNDEYCEEECQEKGMRMTMKDDEEEEKESKNI